tara:strand:+ start:261 stop:389 length:129 start_codon:yes stop_codon:yes gene_type:complete
MQEHKYSLTEIESWMPWEREVYIALLLDNIQKKIERNKKKNG